MLTFSHIEPVFKSALARDYLSAGPSRDLFDYPPDKNGIEKRLAALEKARFDRQGIADRLLAQNRRAGCSPETEQRIGKAADPRAVFITCGHQACLAGGPLFVAYKILTAVKTAEWIEKAFNVPAVPLFWLAADDDDFREVTGAHSPFSGGMSFEPGTDKHVVHSLPNPSAALAGLPAIPAACWGEYHQKLMLRIFGPWGLVCLNPLEKETRALREPFFEKFPGTALQALDAVNQTARDIETLGFSVQVRPRREDRFLFALDGGRRRRLTGPAGAGNDLLLTTSLSRLASIEYFLPVLAEVSGPAEIAYHAETRGIFRLLGRTMPVILPRFSATLVERGDRETLAGCGLEPSQVVENRNAAETRSVENSLPPALSGALNEFSQEFSGLFARTREKLLQQDPALAGAADAAARKAEGIRRYLHKKILSASKKRSVRDSGLGRIFDFLYPGTYQERAYNFLYFIEKYPGFLEGLYPLIKPLEQRHMLIEL